MKESWRSGTKNRARVKELRESREERGAKTNGRRSSHGNGLGDLKDPENIFGNGLNSVGNHGNAHGESDCHARGLDATKTWPEDRRGT